MKVINDFYLFLESEEYDKEEFSNLFDEIEIIMEILGVDLKLKEIKKIGDSEYEAKLDDVILKFPKMSDGHIPNSFRFYSDSDSYIPRVSMENKDGSFHLKFNHPEIKEIPGECDLVEIKKNHELYFLLKKCLDVDTDEDRNNFMDHFKNRCSLKRKDLGSKSELKRLRDIALSFSNDSEISKFYGIF
jgi:hypothetical protein